MRISANLTMRKTNVSERNVKHNQECKALKVKPYMHV